MNRAVLFAISATLAGPAAADTGGVQCAPVSTAAIEGQFSRFNQAFATGDPDKVTALFARDAVLLPTVSNRPRTDRTGIRDYFEHFLANAPVGEINSSTVHLGCNEAGRFGTWTFHLTNKATGAKSDVRARFSFIYKYENGRWWIDHLHSSMMPEKAS